MLTTHPGVHELLDAEIQGWALTRAVRDADGRIADFVVEYMNPAGLDAVSLGADEAIGRRWTELFPAAVDDGLFDVLVEVVERDRPLRRSLFYGDHRLRGYFDLEARPFGAGFALRFADTTDVLVTRVSEQSRDRLQDVFDHTDVGSMLLSPVVEDGDPVDFTIDYINDAALDSVGLGVEDVVGQRLTTAFPTVLEHGWLDAYLHVLRTGEPLSRHQGAYVDEETALQVRVTAMRMGQGIVVTFDVHQGEDPAGPERGDGLVLTGPGRRPLTITAVGSALARTLTFDEVCDALVERLLPAVDATDLALVALPPQVPGPDGLAITARYGDHVAANGEELLEAAREVAAADRAHYPRETPGWAWLPLRSGGAPLGVLGIRLERSLAEPDRRVLETMSSLVGQAVERVRLHLRVELEQAFLSVVLDNLTEAVVVCDATGRLILVNDAAVRLHDADMLGAGPDEFARRFGLYHADGETVLAPDEVPLTRALHGEHVRDDEITIAVDGRPRRVVSCNGQPLEDGQGHVIGAVVAMHDITDRKRAEHRLQRQALHDPLTALPNRRLLLDRIRHALDHRGATAAVMFLDLDRFKFINDSLGHEIGDQVLVAVAARLRATLRPEDTIARIGGDEFVILCEHVAEEQLAIELAERVEAVFADPFELGDGRRIHLSTSVGIALARQGDDPHDVLRRSDQAMYQAKDRGRGGHQFFDADLGEAAAAHLAVQTAVRSAIDDGRLTVHYQPIIDLTHDRGVVAVEALVRYVAPDGSIVPPGQFLDVAEDTGLIVPVGRVVIATVADQLERWREQLGFDLTVSINLSARQLASRQLLRDLEVRIPNGAGGIDVEITESILMEAADSTLRILNSLKDAGARLGIDDFGTGYSSLTYLRRFPVDFVKIDRSFVSGLGEDPEDTVIVRAVVDLARALDLTAVAEGVESAHHEERLRELGCHRAQGYHYARPLPADEVTELILAGGRARGGADDRRVS